MSENINNKYFIVLNEEKIIFSCLDNKKKIFFTKKYDLTNYVLNNLSKEIENFFNDNLIEMEKNLNDFIRKIIIIVDFDDCLSSKLSMKFNLSSETINEQKINDLLTSLRYQFIKYSNDQKVIHMMIGKLLIDGKEKDLNFADEKSQNLILEVKFECLKEKTVNMIKRSLSKYQISIENILIANHLRNSVEHELNDIISLADKFISEGIKNEVVWANKKSIKRGFFEKFFNFFD
jgi:hypothetical protein